MLLTIGRQPSPDGAAGGHLVSDVDGRPAGDVLLVNGTYGTGLDVVTERVRLRLLNASVSRTYAFGLADERPVQLVGTDGGLLAAGDDGADPASARRSSCRCGPASGPSCAASGPPRRCGRGPTSPTGSRPPDSGIRIILRFDDYADPNLPSMFHCHLLMHEDDGMLGQFVPGQAAGRVPRGAGHDHG